MQTSTSVLQSVSVDVLYVYYLVVANIYFINCTIFKGGLSAQVPGVFVALNGKVLVLFQHFSPQSITEILLTHSAELKFFKLFPAHEVRRTDEGAFVGK